MEPLRVQMATREDALKGMMGILGRYGHRTMAYVTPMSEDRSTVVIPVIDNENLREVYRAYLEGLNDAWNGEL